MKKHLFTVFIILSLPIANSFGTERPQPKFLEAIAIKSYFGTFSLLGGLAQTWGASQGYKEIFKNEYKNILTIKKEITKDSKVLQTLLQKETAIRRSTPSIAPTEVFDRLHREANLKLDVNFKEQKEIGEKITNNNKKLNELLGKYKSTVKNYMSSSNELKDAIIATQGNGGRNIRSNVQFRRYAGRFFILLSAVFATSIVIDILEEMAIEVNEDDSYSAPVRKGIANALEETALDLKSNMAEKDLL